MTMASFLAGLTYWHWWIVAAVLFIVEMMAPGVAFLWLAIAAGIVGGILLAVPGLAWEHQVMLFAVLSVISLVAGRTWVKRHPTESDRPDLNQRGAQYIGHRYELIEPIVNGIGRIRVGDSNWRVAGPDMAAGATVVVTGVDGSTLLVGPTDTADA